MSRGDASAGRLRRFRPARSRIAALCAVVLVMAGVVPMPPPAPAAPREAPRPGWVYDRLAFSPAGDSLTVLAWLERPGASPDASPAGEEAAPRRLLVALATRQVAVDPEVVAVQASPDRAHLLLLGERGLWWYDIAAGRTTQLYFQPPDGGARLYDYAFRKGGPGAVFLTGARGDRQGGAYRYLPPGPVERVADHPPGSPAPASWEVEALPHEAPQVAATRGARRFSVPGTPPLRFDYDGATLLVEPGSAAERVAVADVAIEWASWPEEGGVALLALRESSGRPRLLAVSPGRPLRFLLEGFETPSAAWLEPRTALITVASGGIYRYDARADTLGGFPTGRPPAWALADVAPSEVPTLRVTRWPRSARRFEEQQALLGKGAKELPKELRAAALAYGRRLGGAGAQVVGAYPTLETAAAAAPAFRKIGIELEPTTCPALEMAGEFDYGERTNARGDRAWMRRLPGAGGSEIWWHPSGGAPERLLSREMTP